MCPSIMPSIRFLRSPLTLGLTALVVLVMQGCSSKSDAASSGDGGDAGLDADPGKDPGDPAFCSTHPDTLCQDFESSDWSKYYEIVHHGISTASGPAIYEVETTTTGHDLVAWTLPTTDIIGTTFGTLLFDELTTSRFSFDLRIETDGQRLDDLRGGPAFLELASFNWLDGPSSVDRDAKLRVADGKLVLHTSGITVPLVDVSPRWIHVDVVGTHVDVNEDIVVSVDGVEVGHAVALGMRTDPGLVGLEFGPWGNSSVGSRVHYDNITLLQE